MFLTNLYEINRILENKARQNNFTEKNNEILIKQLLSKRYYDFKNIFLKLINNELPPHRFNNHKIKLKSKNIISY